MIGRSSLAVEVQLWSEDLLTSERRHSATAEFVMVAVDGEGRPKTFAIQTHPYSLSAAMRRHFVGAEPLALRGGPVGSRTGRLMPPAVILAGSALCRRGGGMTC